MFLMARNSNCNRSSRGFTDFLIDDIPLHVVAPHCVKCEFIKLRLALIPMGLYFVIPSPLLGDPFQGYGISCQTFAPPPPQLITLAPPLL